MKRRYTFVVNWKMEKSFSKELKFSANNYDDFISLADKTATEIILCPSHLSIYPISKIFLNTPITVGAQVCSGHASGKFAGQISAQSLNEAGCTHAFVGHLEHLQEQNDSVPQQVQQLLSHGVTPIICVNNEVKHGSIVDTVRERLEFAASLSKAVSSHEHVYIAYDLAATQDPAPIDHIENVVSCIAKLAPKAFPHQKAKILYGRGVTPESIGNLKKINALGGFLVGKCGLNFQDFKKVVESK
ncbi:triosephosphate isomerase [bacterium]|nr:triosephosphate isomerase [bacterium]